MRQKGWSRGEETLCVWTYRKRMLTQIQWKVHESVGGYMEFFVLLLQLFCKPKIISKFKKQLMKQMEFLELKCTKTKIKNWMQLKADYRPMLVNKHSLAFPFFETAMPKYVQTPIQLCSFHMLATLCSKFFKQGFTSMWTENFQMYKLGFKEAGESEIKLSTFSESRRQQGSSRNNLLLLYWLH